ncbi:Solanesyl diphosphate synthase 3, chloroplastic/mitochondrial [Glycine max]|nr:Solanesyl diphosphate synthase 3, chloroplastic/mitochondrial [Glycine max]
MLFSRISRNLRGSFNSCRWFLSIGDHNHRFLSLHNFHSRGGDSTQQVMRSLIISKGLPALHSSRYLIHHQSSSIVEDEHDPFSLVADELSLLGNKLRAMVVAEVPKLASAAEYFFKIGVEGKRFRPTVLLLMSTALNLSIHEAPPPVEVGGTLTTDVRSRQQRIAEITEMIHVASLLHDDVLDDADSRRGIGSLNFVMGNKLAVLAGDFLLSRACVALASLKNTEVVSLLAKVVEHLVTGETMQMTTTSDQRCSMEYYMQKTYYKTASLISNSCKAIAILAGQTAEVAMLAFEYGKNLGLAFQLIDDVLDFTGTSASLGKGLSILSPYLFTLILDVLTEQIQEIAPRCMLFADDIVLLGESREELNERLETWRRALETHGFRLSRSKSEYMECKFNKSRRVSNSEVKIGDHIIPQVTRFKYLGSVIQDDGEIEGDVNHRIQAGWMKWRKASGVLCDAKVPIKLKGKFYQTAVRPAILYGTECWAVKSQHETKVGVAEMRMLRWMCGKTRQDKIRNGVIRERVGVAPIVEKMVENRLRWFGHVERRPVDSVVRRVDQMERRQTIRGRGRPKKTIREVIKKDLELNDLDRSMGIVTAPILFAMEEFPQLRTIVDEGFENPANVDLALEYLGKSRGIQRTRELAVEHANLAAAAIDSLPESDDEDVRKSRKALIDLTHRVITRTK